VITVANRPPVASGGPDLHAMPGDLVTLDGGGSSDPDQDALSFDWALVSRPPGSSAALSSASAAAPVFVPDRFGTYVALLTVSDGSASSAPVAVVVQVGVTGPAGNCAPAAAPVASPGPDQNVSFVSGVQLDGTRSTSGRAGPLTFRWSMTSAPAGSTASLSSATSPQAFFITDRVGVYVITLVVNDGCADSAPATVRVTRLNNPPSATVSVSSPVPILVPVALQSFVNDFDGDPITLRWQLVAAPAGSVASFVDATRADPGLTPDLEGSYTLSLVASDAVSSSAPAVVTFTAANLPPVAAGGPDQAGSVSVPVTLDGSSSLDPSRRPLGFSWTLQGPPGSAATLVGPTTPKPSFVPDLPGTYRAQLTVSAGGLSAQATASVAVWPAVTRLAYRVIDADYSTALDRLVVVAADPDALHLYDPRTGSDTAVGLPLTPATVSLSGDGLFAAVAHDGAVSYVDLAGATVVRTLPFVGDQAFAVLGDNAFVYTAQRGPAGDHIRLLAQPVAGGAITTAISSLTGAAHARVRNGAGALYLTSDSQFFFGGIEEYTLSGGTPAPVTPAGGVFTSACGNLWLSQAGTRLFTRCGVVLHASSSAVDDLTNAGTLAHAATSQLFLRHLSDSTAAGEISAIGSADTPFFITSDDQTLRRWDSNGLTQRESVPFPTETVGSGSFKWSGRFVFYRSDGSERYVVLQLDPAAAVVQDFGVVIF
jgi:chitinase